MTGKNHKSNQPIKDNFDTDGVSIDIDDLCSVTMSHYKQEFVGPLKKNDKALSTDLIVQRCTRFIREPSFGPLMTIPVILIG